jgi:hypothetical protein
MQPGNSFPHIRVVSHTHPAGIPQNPQDYKERVGLSNLSFLRMSNGQWIDFSDTDTGGLPNNGP